MAKKETCYLCGRKEKRRDMEKHTIIRRPGQEDLPVMDGHDIMNQGGELRTIYTCSVCNTPPEAPIPMQQDKRGMCRE